MKKIYTIPYGLFILLIIVFIAVLNTTIGVILLPDPVGIGLCLCDILYAIAIILYVRFHCLNYIKISAEGVTYKKQVYTWEKVCLTMDYTVPDFTRNAFTYRVYFNEKYYIREEIKEADKKGFCIDLNDKRLILLLQHYTKKIKILRESPKQKKLLRKVTEYNDAIANQIT